MHVPPPKAGERSQFIGQKVLVPADTPFVPKTRGDHRETIDLSAPRLASLSILKPCMCFWNVLVWGYKAFAFLESKRKSDLPVDEVPRRLEALKPYLRVVAEPK
jgi:hypothetical protein